jgi:hypothetical protein
MLRTKDFLANFQRFFEKCFGFAPVLQLQIQIRQTVQTLCGTGMLRA